MAVRRSRYLRHMGLLFAFLYLPIAVLVFLSFNSSGLPTVWKASPCSGTGISSVTRSCSRRSRTR